jgi:ABC-type phosphate/phosphonate transport system substrate-binding protein
MPPLVTTNDLLRLANDGFDAVFLCLANGQVDAAQEVADALRNLPEGAHDDDIRRDLTIANLQELLFAHPDEPAIQALKMHLPAKMLIRPLPAS